jgi:hypothetical protein
LYSYVVASKPIALYEFSVTQSRNENGDPSLITVPPIEQYATDYTFTTPKYSLGEYQNYFMFVIDAKQKGGLLLDGQPLPHGQITVYAYPWNPPDGWVRQHHRGDSHRFPCQP